jgi:hypothetical protein
LARDPSTPGRLYAAGGGVFRSDDGGHSWTTVAATFEVGPVALVVDAADPTTLYAGTVLGGVQRSTNGGATWQPKNEGLDRTDVLALTADPSNPSVLYVGLDTGGLYKSVDGAESWGPTGLADVSVRAVVVDPDDPGTIYAATVFDGVFKSADGGDSFEPASAGLTTLELQALASDPEAPASLYAGTARTACFGRPTAVRRGRRSRSACRRCAWRRSRSTVAAGVVYAGTRGVWTFEPRCLATCGVCEQCDTLAGCVAGRVSIVARRSSRAARTSRS